MATETEKSVMRATFLCLFGITLIACQAETPTPPAKDPSPLAKLELNPAVHPICEPTGRVRIDEGRFLAFEMDCRDQTNPDLEMFGIPKHFSPYENGWYDGPFTDAIFTLIPPEPLDSGSGEGLVVMYLEDGENMVHVAEGDEGPDWPYSLKELNLRYEVLE